MKAITIKQPFATLIAEGYKEYEFRTWKTDYRGEIYIHAGKSVDGEAMKKFAHLGLDCPTGCVLAKALLTDCVEVDEGLKETLRKKNFLVYSGTTEARDWHCYGFRLENVTKLPPTPARGMLGLWDYEPDGA